MGILQVLRLKFRFRILEILNFHPSCLQTYTFRDFSKYKGLMAKVLKAAALIFIFGGEQVVDRNSYTLGHSWILIVWSEGVQL